MHNLRKVLIAGGSGLVGRTIARQMVAAGVSVLIADLKPVQSPHSRIEYRRLDVLKPHSFAHLIEEYHPDVVINAINVATLFSHQPRTGYQEIITFYLNLYRCLRVLPGNIHYVQVGTTGSGGLGFSIPFTHGDTLEELPIINKAAFSGITTSMLTLLSRSFEGKVRISEVKPGLAIFDEQIFNSSEFSAKLVTLDGGESGHYTYNEIALLTQFMGFAYAAEIAEKVVTVCNNGHSKREMSAFDVIENMNTTIINPTESDEDRKKAVLAEMRKQQGEVHILATGNLGPPSVTRNLILGKLLGSGMECHDDQSLKEILITDPSVKATLEYIENTNLDLAQYLEAECTYHNFELLKHYYVAGAEPWQVAGASLSKATPVV